MGAGLSIMDDDGNEVTLDPYEAASLMCVTGYLDDATVSACPDCRSRVIATVALVDLLDASPPHMRSGELIDLADDAPSLHLYVVDTAVGCDHVRWRDPLFDEWCDVTSAPEPRARR